MKWYADNWFETFSVETAPYKNNQPDPNSYFIGNRFVNPKAVAICIGVYVPLVIIQMIKNTYKPTAERKKSLLFRIWYLIFFIFKFIS